MKIDIIAERYSEPDETGPIVAPDPYQDRLALIVGDALTWHGACRTWPNLYRPSDRAPYPDAYGVLDVCECACVVMHHGKYNKCVMLASGCELPALLPNPNQNGRKIIGEVFIHCGDSETWPGSAGCITVPPGDWREFLAMLSIGDYGTFHLQDRRRKYGSSESGVEVA